MQICASAWTLHHPLALPVPPRELSFPLLWPKSQLLPCRPPLWRSMGGVVFPLNQMNKVKGRTWVSVPKGWAKTSRTSVLFCRMRRRHCLLLILLLLLWSKKTISPNHTKTQRAENNHNVFTVHTFVARQLKTSNLQTKMTNHCSSQTTAQGLYKVFVKQHCLKTFH